MIPPNLTKKYNLIKKKKKTLKWLQPNEYEIGKEAPTNKILKYHKRYKMKLKIS